MRKNRYRKAYACVVALACGLGGIVSAADYFRTFWRRVDDSVKLRRRRELLRMERRKKRNAMASGQPV